MALTLAEMIDLRDGLIRARASGERSVEYAGFKTAYASDAEMRAAQAEMTRLINQQTGQQPVSQIRIRSRKGL